MWTRGRFSNEIVPGLFAVAIDTYVTERGESMWPKLATIKSSKKAKEESGKRSGLGYPEKKGEGAGVTYDVQIQGGKQSWIHEVYALAVRITEEAIEDNLYELGGGGSSEGMKEIFHDLGEVMERNIEVEMAKFFNYGTASTYHYCRDGSTYVLFYTAHKRLDGTTYSNKATTADLTYSSFWANLVAAENQYNERSQRIKKRVSKLWIPPQLEKKSREILYSPDKPDTGNRAISAYVNSGRKIELCPWNEMTDEDAWILQMDGPGIKFFWRRKTRFARERDFQTGDMMVKSDQRWSAEIDDPRDFYGNIPA